MNREDGDWEIIRDGTTTDRCKHCTEQVENGYFEKEWRIPRAVIAYNQGGYDCTVVCLDCILEKAK